MKTESSSYTSLIDFVLLLNRSTSLLNKEQNRNCIEAFANSKVTPDGNLMFGTGICTRHDLSAGIPIDILSYFLLAKLIQEKYPSISIYNILPDAHAEQNRFPTEKIKSLADSYEVQLNAVANFLKLQKFSILRASQYSQDERYAEIINRFPHIENNYIKRQLADLEYLHKYYDVDKKIGWCSKTRTTATHDEPYFDALYQQNMPNSLMWFLYLEPGRRLSNKGTEVVPYTLAPHDVGSRIILGQQKDVKSFISEIDDTLCSYQNKNTYRNYLKKIVRLFNSLFPHAFNGTSWEDRLDKLNEAITSISNNKNLRQFIF